MTLSSMCQFNHLDDIDMAVSIVLAFIIAVRWLVFSIGYLQIGINYSYNYLFE